MDKAEAKELLKVIEHFANGGEVQHQDVDKVWHDTISPMFNPAMPWRIKPTLKPVDLSVLIESGIDCEFSGNGLANIGTLRQISSGRYQQAALTTAANPIFWDECRPRMNHWHHWMGGECPIPEGLKIEILWGDRRTVPYSKGYSSFVWQHAANRQLLKPSADNIIAFKILDLAEGYCWPWSTEK